MTLTPIRGKKNAAFTLVELLAVVAILTVLVAVALPAYNNYAAKSKFSEVVLATAPTKTAIAACAATGDCVSAGAIYLQTTAGTPAPTPSTDGYAFYPFAFPGHGNTPAAYMQAYQWALAGDSMVFGDVCSQAMGIGNAMGYDCIVDQKGNLVASVADSSYQYDLAWVTPTQSAYDSALGVAVAQANASSGSGSAADLPCVGAAAGCAPATKYAQSVSYDQSGNIYATAVSGSNGLNGEQFILAPSYSSGRVDWAESGSCKTRAGGALC
jgi:type IV pilus assembly protein PilA